jgi:hypothetical protein
MGEVWVLGGISADFLGIYYCVKIVEKHTKFWNFEKKKKKKKIFGCGLSDKTL